MKFEMYGNNFLARKYEAPPEENAHIIIPDNVKTKTGNVGEIMVVGPDCGDYKVGDIVIFPLAACDIIHYQGENLLVGATPMIRGMVHPDEKGFDPKPIKPRDEKKIVIAKNITTPKKKLVN